MSHPRPAAEVLSREFLEMRARTIQLAAALDRLDRAAGTMAGDPRLDQLAEALAALGDGQGGRAERLQMIFSRPYDPQWRQRLEVSPARG